MLIGRTDVPSGMSFWHAARKAVIMNVSDLAAKGVQPIAILASLGIPRGLTKEDIEEIGKGLNAGAREYNAHILGGDTNEAADLIISCTAFGTCRKQSIMKRSGAKPNDIVAVTNFFGKPPSGLKILLEKLAAPKNLKKLLVDSVLIPQARLQEGLALAQAGAVTASIDSSDGLAWSLHELSRASNVGFHIDNLPIARETEEFAKLHNLDSMELCLYGGEEYELVLTINPKFWKKAQDAVVQVGGLLLRIGTATKEKTLIVKINSETLKIQPKGWEHFKTN